MIILVFDTETTSLDKPFCYNFGYVIYNTETRQTLIEREFVIEQVWNNLPLFSSAYYAEKRPIYTSALRGKKAVMTKWGYACWQLINDIKATQTELLYAFNSPFDVRVFDFNCDWYKTRNPLDYGETIDIRKLIAIIVKSPEYLDFCLKNNLLTEANNIQATAESITQFLRGDIEFKEDHTALSDARIEKDILIYLLDKGVDITKEESVGLISGGEQVMRINHKGKLYEFEFTKKTNSKKDNTLYLK